MFKRLRFAFVYALRDLLRNRQRTAFALFSIAAGVATVVALRALGLMLTDALTGNAQAFLRGDLRVSASGQEIRVSMWGGRQAQPVFVPEKVKTVSVWADNNQAQITFVTTSELMQVSKVDNDGNGGRPVFATGTLIDPQVYPFYDRIRAEQPSGADLKSLFTGPNQVVVSHRIADQLGLKVGDTMRLSLTDNLHTITGIVPDSAESVFNNFSVFFFGFVYLDRQYMGAYHTVEGSADTAYLKLPEGADQEAISRQIRREWGRAGSDRSWNVLTADSVLRANEAVADMISRFVLLCSLVGLVIGGVGIINTMLVSVNRRSGEIATLKTLGLKGRGVSLLFMAEALLLGVVGSLVGVILGNVLSLLARDFGEQAFGVPLPWRFYLDPVFIGLGLGITITLFFSFLPTLMASRIRPALVLRQGNIPMARAGLLGSILSLLVLIVGLGVMVDLIIGSNRFKTNLPRPLTVGIVGTFAVFVLLGVVLLLMWIFVWLLGKLPSFRRPNLRIALRGLTQHRLRTALSLTALVIGMSSLSGTLIMARSLNVLLYTSLSDPIGGNVVILPILPLEDTIGQKLDQLPGVNGYRQVRFGTNASLLAINGNRNYQRLIDQAVQGGNPIELATFEVLIGTKVMGNPKRGTLVEGRFLTPEDANQAVVVVPYTQVTQQLGVKVGSTLTYRLGNARKDFTVVGLVKSENNNTLIPFSLSDSAIQVPLEQLPKNVPLDLIIADVQPEQVNAVMAGVAMAGTFVFDVGIFDSIISRLLNQMAALPLLVAILSLFAAAALIASTVSLATIERRRQIGILKAVGVKRREALWQLLLENGMVGIMGGLLSLLPTMLILWSVPALTEGIVHLPIPWELIATMLLLSIGITVGATLLTAWGASGEKPLMVLRYE
ncbi:MAG: ABC transporter permease [Anaerolineae bacterium]|nr:ABC transporter permease [Anaerolineae bacterium]